LGFRPSGRLPSNPYFQTKKEAALPNSLTKGHI
jgi:hypothetical protein